jgi:hypothetical protein
LLYYPSWVGIREEDGMAQINYEALQAGWSSGQQRVTAENLGSVGTESDGFSVLSRVLEGWDGDLRVRFVVLLAENVSVATSVRAAMGEPALGEKDIQRYLETQVWFMNSWNHP